MASNHNGPTCPLPGEWVTAYAAGRLAGLRSFSPAAARRAGLSVVMAPSAGALHGEVFSWVSRPEAERFAEHVARQRADGRARGFGFTYPAPGVSAAAVSRRRAEAARATALPYTAPEAPDVGDPQGDPGEALEGSLARLEGRLEAIAQSVQVIARATDRLADALVRELGMHPPAEG